MSLQIRRVVTGHDKNGKAVVTIDEIAQKVSSRRPGQAGCLLWTTQGFPVDNLNELDGATRAVGTTLENGTVFRIVRYEPGVSPRIHRSNSIDYAVVLGGSITMQLDDGVEVTLRAGDTLVQRGTVHNWINRGTEACTIAFVLIDALPLEVGGRSLAAIG
jgi:quercetin dioxygenase-like cupin family protein